jgi:hypothetical protein
MWKPRRLTILRASAACYRDGFTFLLTTSSNYFTVSKLLMWGTGLMKWYQFPNVWSEVTLIANKRIARSEEPTSSPPPPRGGDTAQFGDHTDLAPRFLHLPQSPNRVAGSIFVDGAMHIVRFRCHSWNCLTLLRPTWHRIVGATCHPIPGDSYRGDNPKSKLLRMFVNVTSASTWIWTQLHEAESFLRSHQLLTYSRISQRNPKVHYRVPYPEPD